MKSSQVERIDLVSIHESAPGEEPLFRSRVGAYAQDAQGNAQVQEKIENLTAIDEPLEDNEIDIIEQTELEIQRYRKEHNVIGALIGTK